MIKVSLLDSRQLVFDHHPTAQEIISAIDQKLLGVAIAATVNGIMVDLSQVISSDSEFRIITISQNEGLEILRHSAAHLLAQAVAELFPSAQATVGPAIENGFYHDFYYPPGFTEDDLLKIEDKMREFARADFSIVRSIKSRREAREFFAKLGANYKVMMIEDLPSEEISFYSQGNFTNACRGPHVPSTGYLRAFKLTKLSGAYWKGDAKNEMLQRIYGTAWVTEEELAEYLEKLEKAKSVDHRIIGKKMDLFHLQEEAPGIVFWHPKGWTILSEIKKYLADKLIKFGYQEVSTPIILDRTLWEKSGHWENYKSSMFITESENRTYAVKPMNCPGKIQIFKQGLKSYRDLPIRYCEFGYCHRNEVSGSLHGILRVRGFTMDDGHIFCTEEQIAVESHQYISQALSVLADFGFKDDRVTVKLSTRPKERIGTDAIWDKAENALIEVLNGHQISWELSPGDGAFYGPKIEFSLHDSLGRTWQAGTLQVDFFMPERLGAYYITEAGEKKAPILLHRAIVGSLERFIGILLEEMGGDLPLWLAPIQAVVLNITDAQREYGEQIVAKIREHGYRVISDMRNEKVGFKIREHSIAKIPYILVVGNKEMAVHAVSVRMANGKDLGQISVEKLVTEVMMSNLRNKI